MEDDYKKKEIWIRFNEIKTKLETLDKSFSLALPDIETLADMTNEITSTSTDSRNFLRLTSIHILPVTILEFLLKKLKKVEKIAFCEIINYIKNSPVLNKKEKNWLIYFILIRHTIIHKYGHYDDEFKRNVKKYIEQDQLKVIIPKEDSYLTTLPPDKVEMCIKILRKYVYLDAMSCNLSKNEKKFLEDIDWLSFF